MPGGLIFPNKHLQGALPPEKFAAEIMEIEAELDQLHPPWKQPARSRLGRGIVGTKGIQDLEVKARCKWLLQRRKHLYDGKDWDVVVRSVHGRDGRVKMVAMPIIPRKRVTPESLRAAARKRMAGREEKQASLPQIAHRLGVPLKRLEALLLGAPEGSNLYHYARRKLAQEAAQGAGKPLSR